MPTRKSERNIKAVPVAAPNSSGMGSNRATRAQTRQSTKDRHSDESEYVPPVKTLNPQMFSRFVPEATEEEEQLQKTIDNLKAKKRALEEEEKTVQEFMRLAKKTDPQYLYAFHMQFMVFFSHVLTVFLHFKRNSSFGSGRSCLAGRNHCSGRIE